MLSLTNDIRTVWNEIKAVRRMPIYRRTWEYGRPWYPIYGRLHRIQWQKHCADNVWLRMAKIKAKPKRIHLCVRVFVLRAQNYAKCGCKWILRSVLYAIPSMSGVSWLCPIRPIRLLSATFSLSLFLTLFVYSSWLHAWSLCASLSKSIPVTDPLGRDVAINQFVEIADRTEKRCRVYEKFGTKRKEITEKSPDTMLSVLLICSYAVYVPKIHAVCR